MKTSVCILLVVAAAAFGADEKKNEKRGVFGLGYGGGLLGHGYGGGLLGHGYYGHGLGLYNNHLGWGGLDYYGGLGHGIASPLVGHGLYGHGLGAPLLGHSVSYGAPLVSHAPLLGLGHGWR